MRPRLGGLFPRRGRAIAKNGQRVQQPLHLHQHHFGETRLDQDCAGAGVARPLNVGGIGIGRDDEDRRRARGRIRPQQPAQLEAVDPRQPCFGDNDAGTAFQRNRERLPAVGGFVNLVGGGAEVLRVHLACIPIAIDEQSTNGMDRWQRNQRRLLGAAHGG